MKEIRFRAWEKDYIGEYATAALFTLIGLVVLAITSAVVYRLIMWIIGG